MSLPEDVCVISGVETPMSGELSLELRTSSKAPRLERLAKLNESFRKSRFILSVAAVYSF